jgi:hypothetical protein
MGTQIQVSAKILAEVAMPDFCPRCYWIKLHVPKKLPYQTFPGIFSSIDSYTKHIVHGEFDRHHRPPAWLADLPGVVGYRNPPPHTTFRMLDPVTNILLTGVVDGIFVHSDGSHLIVDYKTAKYTAAQDRLYPLYEAQLNAYALIGETCGFAPISGLALIYAEPVSDRASADEAENHSAVGFRLGFVPKVLTVPILPDLIPPLLVKTREIFEQQSVPEGRIGCENCRLLNDLLRIVGPVAPTSAAPAPGSTD